MGQLKEAQQKMEETKERLKTITMVEESSNGKVRVTISAAREIKDIHIDDKGPTLLMHSPFLVSQVPCTFGVLITKPKVPRKVPRKAPANVFDPVLKAIAKSRILRLHSCFIHIFLI